MIARQCFAEAVHKGQLKGEAKAIRVPRGRHDKIPPQAFSFHTDVRHVPVEPGVRIVGEAAWRSCRQLQVVHLPDTVVSLLHGAFSRCRVLRAVTAPGCQHFGTKVFEECCSLTQIGVTQVSSLLPPVPCPSSLSQFPAPSSLSSLLPPVPCPKFPVPSLLPPVPCPPLPCPQFPVPSSLSPFCRPHDLRLCIQQLEISLA